jgi:hypothetical protein
MIPLFFSILPLCVIPIQETPEGIHNFIHCLNSEKKIEQVIEWEPLISKYFKEEDRAEALLIVYCESRGMPKAVGTNTNGTKDVGLWQFNDDTWNWLTPKLKITSKRTNPVVSTAVASWLYYNDGNHHWNPSSKCWRTNARD